MINEWISVEDLPEGDGWYICHFSDGSIETYYFIPEDGGFVPCSDCVVTHWMPLPSPPE